MDRPALIVIGANEYQARLVEKAREMGYETHVFAWEAGAVCHNIADHFYPISITDIAAILKVAQGIKPVGVVSIASDLAVLTVNHLASELGVTGNSLNSTRLSTNKYEMRKAFSKADLPSPKFILADKEAMPRPMNMEFPLIVKPVDRSGSRGVNLVNNLKDMNLALEGAIDESFSGKAIIEEYVPGQEYSMEMISYRGQHHFLAITEKFTSGPPNFVEVMHLQPGRIERDALTRAIEIIKSALDALHIKYGASHSEFKVNEEGNITVIEIGARMGGDFIGSDMVRLSTGFDFTRMVVDVAVGKEPDLSAVNMNKAVLVRFLMDQEDMTLLNNLLVKHSDKIHSFAEWRDIDGQVITDSSQRLGYFILISDTSEECLQMIS